MVEAQFCRTVWWGSSRRDVAGLPQRVEYAVIASGNVAVHQRIQDNGWSEDMTGYDLRIHPLAGPIADPIDRVFDVAKARRSCPLGAEVRLFHIGSVPRFQTRTLRAMQYHTLSGLAGSPIDLGQRPIDATATRALR